MRQAGLVQRVFLLSLVFLSTKANGGLEPFGFGRDPVPDSYVLKRITPDVRAKEKLPLRISLLVWNAHKGEAGSAWAKDLKMLSAESDLVLLQEAMVDNFMPQVMRSLSLFDFIFARSFEYSERQESTGVSTGALAFAKKMGFLRSPGSEPFLGIPKMSLITQYEMEDQEALVVVNVHGINFVGNSEFERQMDQISAFLKKRPGRAIWAGDFNTWNSARLRYLKELGDHLEMEQVFFPNDDRMLQLDHVFVRGCQANKARIRKDVESSDHAPLQVRLDCTRRFL